MFRMHEGSYFGAHWKVLVNYSETREDGDLGRDECENGSRLAGKCRISSNVKVFNSTSSEPYWKLETCENVRG